MMMEKVEERCGESKKAKFTMPVAKCPGDWVFEIVQEPRSGLLINVPHLGTTVVAIEIYTAFPKV